MNRKHFLKSFGALGLAAALPVGRAEAAASAVKRAAGGATGSGSCVLIPTETAGPYPTINSTNAVFLRSDVRENRTGALLTLTLQVNYLSTCLPIANARVEIWHCDKDGYYSGYTTSGHQGSQNNGTATWLRGIQLTNANGEVTFTTVFPGWYSGRVSHIHFRITVGATQTISQLSFPVAAKNQIYTTHPLYAQYGADPASLNTDMVFADGYANQLATLTANSTTGGYDSFLEVAVNAANAMGLMDAERETGGQFTMGQNFPNPGAGGATAVPFALTHAADVKLELYDRAGRRVREIAAGTLAAGAHQFDLSGLAAGSYVYQLLVSNANGGFHQSKLMTIL